MKKVLYTNDDGTAKAIHLITFVFIFCTHIHTHNQAIELSAYDEQKKKMILLVFLLLCSFQWERKSKTKPKCKGFDFGLLNFISFCPFLIYGNLEINIQTVCSERKFFFLRVGLLKSLSAFGG